MKKLLLRSTIFVCSLSLFAIDPFSTDHHQEKLTMTSFEKKLSDQALQVALALTEQAAKSLPCVKRKDQVQKNDAIASMARHSLFAMSVQKDAQNRLQDDIDESVKIDTSSIADKVLRLHDKFGTSWTKFVDKIDEIQDVLRDVSDDMRDEVYELMHVIAVYRNYKLLTLGQENNDYDMNDIENFIHCWGKSAEEKAARKQEKQDARQTRKDEKQARKDAKREEKESKKEEKTSSSSSSNSSSSSHSSSSSSTSSSSSSSNSTNSSNQTTTPSDTLSNDHSSSQNSTKQPTDKDKKDDNKKQDVITLVTPDKPVSIHNEVYHSGTNVAVTPDILGDITYNPDDDVNKDKNQDKNEDNKVAKKPEYTPPTSEEKPKQKLPYGMQQSINQFGQQGPCNGENNKKMNDMLESYNQDLAAKCMQKLSEYGYNEYMHPSQKESITQRALESALKEVNDEYRERDRQRKAQEAQEKQEKQEQRAADQKIQDEMKKVIHDKIKSELAPDRGLAERALDYLLCRDKRKKETSPNQSEALNTPPSQQNSGNDVQGDNAQQNSNDSGNNVQGNGTQQNLNNLGDGGNKKDDLSPTDNSEIESHDDLEVAKDPIDTSMQDTQPGPLVPIAPTNPTVPTDPVAPINPHVPTAPDAQPDDQQPQNYDWSSSKNDFSQKPCQMPQDQANLLRRDLLQDTNGQPVSTDDRTMINHMINSMVRAQNDSTIELAQAGLKSWQQSQQAQSPQERDHYAQQAKNYYASIQQSAPATSIADQKKSMQSGVVDGMLQKYQTQLQDIRQAKASNAQLGSNVYYNQLEKRFDKRQQALLETQQQINTNNLPYRKYSMNADTRGYLMANNLNYASFDSMIATSYQHCLAQENLDLLASSVNMALHHADQPGVKAFSNQICDLAITSQQLNQQGKINEATAITDMNDFFAMYGSVMLDDQLEGEYTMKAMVEAAKVFIGISKGIQKGGTSAACKWGTFVGNVCTGDKVTFEKMRDDLKNLGHGLGAVAQALTEAYKPLLTKDGLAKDVLVHFNTHQEFLDHWESLNKKNQEQIDKITGGAATILKAGHKALEGMMQRSIEDNVAGITEGIIDTIVIGKSVQAVGLLTQTIGGKCLQAAEVIAEKVPTNLLGSAPQIINGQAVAVAGGQSVNLTQAIAAGAQGLVDPLIDTTKLGLQSNNLYNKIKESSDGKISTGGGSGGKQPESKGKTATAPEPVKGSEAWNKKYPKGEFRPSAKHNPNSPDHIGKPPRDGQAALNNSFDVKESLQRVAIQDDKVIILKFEENGIYHGYIHEDISTLSKKVKDALVDNGFMKDATSKKLIRK